MGPQRASSENTRTQNTRKKFQKERLLCVVHKTDAIDEIFNHQISNTVSKLPNAKRRSTNFKTAVFVTKNQTPAV